MEYIIYIYTYIHCTGGYAELIQLQKDREKAATSSMYACAFTTKGGMLYYTLCK